MNPAMRLRTMLKWNVIVMALRQCYEVSGFRAQSQGFTASYQFTIATIRGRGVEHGNLGLLNLRLVNIRCSHVLNIL